MRAKPECFPRGTSGRAPERSGGAQRPAGVSRSAPAPNSSRREARTPSQVPSLPTARPSLRKRDDNGLPGRNMRRRASAQQPDWRSGPGVSTAFLATPKRPLRKNQGMLNSAAHHSFLSGGQEGRPTIRGALRLTYLCSRSCERSEQFARSSAPARALLIFQNPRASGRSKEAKPFAESARTEHRSETQCSEGRSGYVVLCDGLGANSKVRVLASSR